MSLKSVRLASVIFACLLLSAFAEQGSFSINDVPKMNVEQRRKLFGDTDTPVFNESEKFLDLFILGLNDADKVTQRKAAQKLSMTMAALQRMKRGGEPVLVDLSKMGELQNLLASKLSDPDRETRGAVIRALAFSDAPTAKTETALLNQLGQEPDEQLKAGVLQTMAFAGYDSARFGQALLQALNGTHEVQISAAEAVAIVRPPGALPTLISMLERRQAGGAPVVDAIAAYAAEARPFLPQLEKLLGDPSLPGDLRDRVRQVIEAIKNPKPAAQAEPKGKAVALVDAISPQAPPPTAAPAAAPAPAPSVPTATPSLSSPAPTVAESPAPVVERKSPAWPGVVGIAALTVIAVLVWKRRRGRAGSAL